MKKIFLTIAILSTQKSYAQNDFIAVSPESSLRSIGLGYDSNKQVFFHDCFQGGEDEIGASTGDIGLKLVTSQKEISDSLGMSSGFRARVGVAEASGSASFARASQENQMSLNFNYKAEYFFTQRRKHSPTNPIVPNSSQNISEKDNMYFSKICGDRVITEVRKAAKLFVAIKVKFSSASQKEQFRMNFGYSSPVFSASGEAQMSKSAMSQGAEIEIHAFQMGGQPQNLGAIFCPYNEGNSPINCQQRSYNVLNCSFGNMQDCIQLLAQIQTYAHNRNDPDSFYSQLQNKSNFVITAFKTLPYTNLSKKFPAPPTAVDYKNFEQTVAKLHLLFEEILSNWILADQIATSRVPRLESFQKIEMTQTASQIKQNLDRVTDAISLCYETGTAPCSAALVNVLSTIHYADSGFLNAEKILTLAAPRQFLQYCDENLNNSKQIEKFSTLSFLLAYADYSLRKEHIKELDPCKALSTFYNDKIALDFSEFHPASIALDDLSLFSLLPNLKSLNVSNQHLVRTNGLEKANNLKFLYLSHNYLENVEALAQLSNLQHLEIDNNKLIQIPDFKPAPHLHFINISKNSLPLTCPSNVPKCLDYFISASSSIFQTNCGPIAFGAATKLRDGRILITGQPHLSSKNSKAFIIDNGKCTRIESGLLERSGQFLFQFNDDAIAIFGGTQEVTEWISLSKNIFQDFPAWSNLKLTPALFASYTVARIPNGKTIIVRAGGFFNLRPNDFTGDVSTNVEIIDGETGVILNTLTLNQPRAMHSATLANGKIIFAGGFDGSQTLSSVETLDLGNMKLSISGMLAKSRAGHSAVIMPNNKILYVGGFQYDNQLIENAKKLLNDPQQTSNYASNLTNFYQSQSPRAIPSMELLDIGTTKTELLPMKLNLARGQHQATLTANGNVVIFGGTSKASSPASNTGPSVSQNGISSIEIVNTNLGVVSTVGKLTDARTGASILELNNNSFLIIGGLGATDPTAIYSNERIVFQ